MSQVDEPIEHTSSIWLFTTACFESVRQYSAQPVTWTHCDEGFCWYFTQVESLNSTKSKIQNPRDMVVSEFRIICWFWCKKTYIPIPPSPLVYEILLLFLSEAFFLF